jgi:hypothetical protein
LSLTPRLKLFFAQIKILPDSIFIKTKLLLRVGGWLNELAVPFQYPGFMTYTYNDVTINLKSDPPTLIRLFFLPLHSINSKTIRVRMNKLPHSRLHVLRSVLFLKKENSQMKKEQHIFF